MKFIVIQIVFLPKERYHFAVDVFKIFSLPLVFRSLIVMCLGMDCSDLFCLVIIQLLDGLVYTSCQICTFLSHYFFSFLPFPPSFCDYSDYSDMHVKPFVIVS